MKQGLNFHLAVSFDTDLDNIETVEFLFSRKVGSPNSKKEIFPGAVKRRPGTNILLVPFTKEETYKFDGDFYLDTRITFKDTKDQPETPIIKLTMNDTLFEKEDDVPW